MYSSSMRLIICILCSEFYEVCICNSMTINLIWFDLKITRLVAAIKSLRFALLDIYMFMSSIIIPFYHKINLRSQRTSNAESISMAWCHHVLSLGKKALDRGQISPTPFPQQNKFDWKQDCFLQKEARVCLSDAIVIEDNKFKLCFLLWKMSKW